MAEVVLKLPPKGKIRSAHHALFLKISDGQVWKVSREEYTGHPRSFQSSVQQWARHRNFQALTRRDAGDDSIYVQFVKGANSSNN